MAEIILSFFAVIGILFFIIYLCDYLFYRNFHPNFTLTLDTRDMSLEACIDSFELINTVRQTAAGKAILSNLSIIVSDFDDEKARLSKEYIKVFDIPAVLQERTNDLIN